MRWPSAKAWQRSQAREDDRCLVYLVVNKMAHSEELSLCIFKNSRNKIEVYLRSLLACMVRVWIDMLVGERSMRFLTLRIISLDNPQQLNIEAFVSAHLGQGHAIATTNFDADVVFFLSLEPFWLP